LLAKEGKLLKEISQSDKALKSKSTYGLESTSNENAVRFDNLSDLQSSSSTVKAR
jgi:hypothetical protein